jgi:hypothetical protein
VTKRKSKYGLDRVAFNRKAKELRADDNLPALKDLAVKQVFPKPYNGSPVEELWQTLAMAAVGVVVDWWENGGKLPHDRIRKAISAADRVYRGQGGNAANVTWRGGYSPKHRKFASQSPETQKALDDVMDEDEPEITRSGLADHDEHKAERHEGFAAQAEIEGNQKDYGKHTERAERAAEAAERAPERGAFGKTSAEGTARAATGAASYTGEHDGDTEHTRDPGREQDHETAYGVDGATRGLHTGRVRVSDWDEAKIEGMERLRAQNLKAWDLLNSIQDAGSYSPRKEEWTWSLDNYISKSVDRKRRRDQIVHDAVAAARELKRFTREVMVEIEAGTFPPVTAEEQLRQAPIADFGRPLADYLAAPVAMPATLPPIDVEGIRRAAILKRSLARAAERAAGFGEWQRRWLEANPDALDRVELPPLPHGERLGPQAYYEAWAARREVMLWLARVEGGRDQPMLSIEHQSLLDYAKSKR